MFEIEIDDPSGEMRRIPLRGALSLTQGVELRDPTLPEQGLQIWPVVSADETTYWVRVPEGAPSVALSGIQARETQLPLGMPMNWGETRVTLVRTAPEQVVPAMPSGVRPWWTQSESGRKTLWMVKKAAATPLAVYLGGETGTGKEVLARLVHQWSDRVSGAFVAINCGALPASLAESELFGHVKGAFTGAVQHRAGALMQAHNGTLFLDEIGDLPLELQVKLLRFLEDGEIRPVGADRCSRADVRIVCATHKPLKQLVEEGQFRRDLFYRLASVSIEIPPLRTRPEDIEYLSNQVARELGKTISPAAMLRLKAHQWPGNVRELRHAIERASGWAGVFAEMLTEDAFEFLMQPDHVESAPELELGAAVLTLDEMERVMLLKALRLAEGNRAVAAQILGVARSTLFEMLKRHRIQGPRSKRALIERKHPRNRDSRGVHAAESHSLAQ